MASSVIAEAIIIIAAAVIASTLAGIVISRVYTVDSVMANIVNREKMLSMISAKLSHVSCLSDTNMLAYVKNTGLYPINMSQVDVLVGSPGNEVPIWSIGGSATPDPEILQPGMLGVINITLSNPITGIVSIRLIYPNGASDFMVCSW